VIPRFVAAGAFSLAKTAYFLLMNFQLQVSITGLQGNNARHGSRAGHFNLLPFQENTDSC